MEVPPRVDRLLAKAVDEQVSEQRLLREALEDAVADELRKAVTELARLLVRDRTRINRTLTEHRNAIVAELRLPATNGHTVNLRRDDDEEDDYDVDDEPDVVAVGGARRLLRRL